MTFEVTLTTDDWTDFRRAVAGQPGLTDRQRRKAKNARRGVVAWAATIGLVLVLIAAYRLTAPGVPVAPRADSGLSPLIAALLPGLVGFVALWVGVRLYNGPIPKRNPLLDRVLTYDVSAAAVAITDGPEQTIRRWGAFDLFTEADRLLLLRVAASKSWVILPKRAIADPADLAAVRRLFEAAAPPSAAISMRPTAHPPS